MNCLKVFIASLFMAVSNYVIDKTVDPSISAARVREENLKIVCIPTSFQVSRKLYQSYHKIMIYMF